MKYGSYKIIFFVIAGSLLSFSVASAKSFTIFNAASTTQPYFSVNGLTGNVGIGITAPVNVLQVEGNGSGTGLRVGAGTKYLEIYAQTAGTTVINSTGHIYFQRAGVRQAFVSDHGINAGTNKSIGFGDGEDTTMGWDGTNFNINIKPYSYSSDATQIIIKKGTAEYARISNNGNFGIGTTSPTARLEVVPTSGYSILAGSLKLGNVALPTADADAATKGYIDSSLASATSSITLWGGTTGGNIWNLNSGNVGIGTTTPPTDKLYVQGNIGLPISTTTEGVIKMGGQRYIHSFGNTYNTFVGYQSGNFTTTATENTFVGAQAGYSLSTGSYNTAIGRGAGNLLTTGMMNTLIGRQTGANITSGNGNTLVGLGAGESWAGSNAVMMGSYAGRWNSGGNYNIIIGAGANGDGNTNSNTVAVGNAALSSVVNGSQNIALGGSADFYTPSYTGSAALTSGNALSVGMYYYRTTFVLSSGETNSMTLTTIATTAGNQAVNLSAIPVYSGPYTCTARKIYRTKVGVYGRGPFYLLTTINDNTTTTYPDTTPDTSLTTVLNDRADSIMIGYSAKAFKSNQIILGANQSEIYLGKGVYSVSPGTISLLATGGSGANNPGANLVIAGGPGTGSADGGNITFQTASAGGSGSLFNSLSNRMIIDDNGNVGIGTTSPTARLEVVPISGYSILAGSFKIGNVALPTADADAATKGYVDSSLAYATSSMITMPVGTTGQTLRHDGTDWIANSVIYNNGTNVGVGLANPGDRLALPAGANNNIVFQNAGGNGYYYIGTTRSGYQPYFGYTIKADPNINNGFIKSNADVTSLNLIQVANATGDINFALKAGYAGGAGDVFDPIANSKMIIKQSGNIGIGITNPVGLLHVYSAASSSQALVVAPNGYVGIGKNNPIFRLDVLGNTYIQGLLYNWGDASIQSLYLGYGAAYPAILSTQSTDEDLTIDPNGTGRIIMQGNVGIGTTSPTARLEVVPISGYSILAGSFKIGNVALPTADADAATKGYVDTAIASATSTGSLPAGTTGQTLRHNGTTWVGNSVLYNDGTNVGIGTTAPNSKFEVGAPGVTTDYDVNFYGFYDTNPDTPVDARFFWDASKGAFRVGSNGEGTAWNDANVGNYSIGLGYGNTASGPYSTALGLNTTASGPNSTALGSDTTASGSYSTALGFISAASGDGSIAMGWGPIASGRYSVALGANTTAQAYMSTVLGTYNVVSGTTNSWVATDPLFVIGNGSGSAARSNALTVLKNGNVGIGTTAPNAKLAITNNIATGFLNNYSEYQELVYDNGTAGGSYGMGVKSNYFVFNSGAGGYSFDRAGAATAMVIDMAGNIGIGTTDPSAAKLVVAQTSGYSILAGTSTTATYKIGNVAIPTAIADAATKGYVDTAIASATSTGGLPAGTTGQTLRHNGTTWVGNSALYNNGTSIGIGTNNPNYRLQVGGGSTSLFLTTTDFAESTTGSGIAMGTVTDTGNAAGQIVYFISGRSAYGNLSLQSYGGNVGIGTTTPSATLAVDSGTDTNALQVQGSNSDGTGINFTVKNNDATANSFAIYQMQAGDNAHGGMFFGSRAANNSYGIVNGITFRAMAGQDIGLTAAPAFGSLTGPSIIIRSGGNVGISTSTPTARLSVDPGSGYAILAGQQRIGNLALPTADADAATKGYVDSATGGTSLWDGTMGGNIWNLNSGNVGIGTTAPGSKLALKGAFSIEGAATTNNAILNYTVPYYGRLNYSVTPNNGKSEVRFVSRGATAGSGQTYFVIASTEVADTGNNLLLGVSAGRAFIANALDYSTAGSLHLGGYSWDEDGVVQISGLSTDTTGRMTVIGNVGIGTTNPSYKLDVQDGQINASGGLCIAGVCQTTWPAGGGTGTGWATSSTNIYNTNTGNVGIGTTTPAGKLNVYGNGNIAALFTNGNVGIGTTNPQAKLEVSSAGGGGSGIGLRMTNAASYGTIDFNTPSGLIGQFVTTGASFTSGSFLSNEVALTNSSSSIHLSAYGANGFIRFTTGANTIASERMRITNAGNVDIGTTNPGARLEVAPTSGYAILAGTSTTATYKIGNVALPTVGTDAATKAYVDSAAGSGVYLPLAGGAMTGSIDMGNNNITNLYDLTVSHKLTVDTIDPLYRINGINYSSFASSVVGGVKEEYLGKIKLEKKNKQLGEFEAIIDFSDLHEGSDLWVWRQVVDFNKDNIDIAITPYGHFAAVYYLIDGNKLIFRSDRPVEISYRLVGKRFDWRTWPTLSEDQATLGTEIKVLWP